MRSVVAVTATLLACAPPRGGLVLPGVLAKQKPPTTSFYAGLRNQGNTCYLNSLVQTLYHVRPFRETVLRTCVSLDAPPPKRRLLSRLNPLSGRRKSQRPPGSTAEALAAIFARLASNATGETRWLTSFLGVDPLEQQDAQEFLRLVLDEIPDVSLYAGEVASYLRLTDEEAAMVGERLEKVRRERFLDLSLDVVSPGTTSSSTSSVADALRSFFAPEHLTGDERWRTAEYGLRDALKGVRVTQLPPILVLHLKRFAYDASRGLVRKVDRRFDFPVDLDAADHVPFAEDAKKEARHTRYRLHAVVCHVGAAAAGHYFALVDPRCDGRWVLFDDHRVTRGWTRDQVLELGRGGNPGRGSAYLLQYVREDYLPLLRDDDEALSGVPPSSGPLGGTTSQSRDETTGGDRPAGGSPASGAAAGVSLGGAEEEL